MRTFPKIVMRTQESCTISNLTPDQINAIEGMLRGANFISCVDGELKSHDLIARLPDPIIEPWEAGSWVHSNQTDGIPSRTERKEWCCPTNSGDFSIVIESLCGFGYSKENYKHEAMKLLSFGFECCRSRRDLRGLRTEVWYLPGMWAATGRMHDAFPDRWDSSGKSTEDIEKRRRDITEWLCENVAFGRVNLTTCQAAMCAG